MRILISAYTISPLSGSEAGIGWGFASRLAEKNDVTVLYGGDTDHLGPELKAWLTQHPAIRLEPVYVAPGRLSVTLSRLHGKPGLVLLYYLAYQLWQRRVLMMAQRLHREKPFDLSHQLTYTGFWEPGYLWKLEIPFFWGPVSGANAIPLKYLPILGTKGTLGALTRFVFKKSTFLIRPRVRAAAKRASHIWCVSNEEKKIFDRFNDRKSIMLDAGSNPTQAHIRTVAAGQPTKFVWSGSHIPRKALPILIRAIGEVAPAREFEVHILGAGYDNDNKQTEAARLLAKKLGVASHLRWWGKLPRDQALRIMYEGHILVHTSLLEAASWVVMEAISSGMPVICHDACGMAVAVTNDCGIKVPMTGIHDSVQGFARAMQRLIDEPAYIEKLSRGAVLRSAELRWETIIEEMNRAFRATLAEST